jgi:hypothetical protein
VTASYEAEAAELSGFVTIFEVEEASGGEVVGWIGGYEFNYVRFVDVRVERAGEYELALHYVGERHREGVVAVNDGEPTTIDFPSLDRRTEVGSVTVTVELVAGRNEIWFGNPEDRAPALDRITVTG